MNKLITLILLLSINIYASEAQVQREFKKFYYSDQVADRFCKKNIEKFAKHLQSKKLLDYDFKMIIIEAFNHSWTFGYLPAFNSRFGRELNGMLYQSWTYHAIALYRGKVYDFSFNQRPKVLEFDRYMDEMFIPARKTAIHGPTFRTQGKGPYLTIKEAKKEREDFSFKIYQFDSQASGSTTGESLKFNDFSRYVH